VNFSSAGSSDADGSIAAYAWDLDGDGQFDDSTAQNPGTADEGQTAQNARKAVQDEGTIFYLGEFNSGGTKVSLPILNKANIPQISPSNTYVGLTTDAPGSEPGEPDKYYPTGKRTYARVVAADHHEGAAGVPTAFEVESAPDVDVRQELARAIVTRGWGLLELRPVRMSLEDVFLEVTSNPEENGR